MIDSETQKEAHHKNCPAIDGFGCRCKELEDSYEQRVQALEEEGLTRSDAQGVVDAEILKETT
jgi:hypothetical protein